MPQQAEIVEIDGSHGEGGGQLLRTSIALSAITGKAVHIRSIRAGRPNPGLQAQHLKAIEAVASLCDARLKGAEMRSTELTFEPMEIKPRQLRLDIGTAGSVTLVLQAFVLAAGCREGETVIDLSGGTHVSWSPPVDYFQKIFCHHLSTIGIQVEIKTLKHGFYPKGGGRIQTRIKGSNELKGLDLRHSKPPESTRVRSVASEELRKGRVAERQIDGFKSVLNAASTEDMSYVRSLSIGSAIFGYTDYGSTLLGADALGRKGLKAEDVGIDASRQLKAEMECGATLDVHAADMMMPYLALASKSSQFLVRETSGHLTSVQWLIRQFVDVDFTVERKEKVHAVSVNPKH